MKDVVQTIKKLLALGERGGTEQEGQAAIEQARRLLAKHKLEEAEVRGAADAKLPDIITDSVVWLPRQPEAWEALMIEVIAEAFGCIGFAMAHPLGTHFSLCFMGEKENVETAIAVTKFAVEDMILGFNKVAGTEVDSGDASIPQLNGYFLGYVYGLKQNFEREQEESTALVVQRPQRVLDAFNEAEKGPPIETAEIDATVDYFHDGVMDGKAFDHTKRQVRKGDRKDELSLLA